MLAEWSVECGPDDPVLVVPWSDPSDPSGERRFIDLRENPYDLDEIPETEQHPALLQALRALNANRSPVFTAKCDAWVMDADELAALHLEIELETADPAHDLAHGFASYIDLVWRERGLFVSFHQQEQLLHRLVRQAELLDLPYAALACTLRPALVDLNGPQEGFALTLYVKALGADAGDAYRNWTEALAAAVALVRSKVLRAMAG